MSDYPKMLVSLLQVKYPKPRSSLLRQCASEGYCVGGAFMLEHSEVKDNFPDEDTLTVALLGANRSLAEEQAQEHAQAIIDLNDRGAYTDAWTELETALRWRNW